MRRYLEESIRRDLAKKIVLLSGPRQVGKTTLARSLAKHHDYFNWDAQEDRIALREKSWDRKQELIVFDELHKMKNFKSWLKGVYDKEGVKPKIIVTGSARLDVAKKMGDSLAGRFFAYRLFPLDLWEIGEAKHLESNYQTLLTCSGFPEPFLSNDAEFYARWARSHVDMILRQDLLDLESVSRISAIETLLTLLASRIGSTISYSSLARDLEVNGKTVKRWLGILENLFVIFKVTPFHRNVARSLRKEPKYYFFDVARVRNGEAAQFENLVALSLRKRLSYLEDTRGTSAALNYLRTKEGHEIDFCVSLHDKTLILLECKLSDQTISPHFKRFAKFLKPIQQVQLVRHCQREKSYPTGEELRAALPWLHKMPLE